MGTRGVRTPRSLIFPFVRNRANVKMSTQLPLNEKCIRYHAAAFLPDFFVVKKNRGGGGGGGRKDARVGRNNRNTKSKETDGGHLNMIVHSRSAKRSLFP